MGQVGQFGASPIVAMFQGFINGAPALITRAAQNCSVTRPSAGKIQIALNNVYPDDANYLVQVQQFGAAPVEVSVSYGGAGGNSSLPGNVIQLAFNASGVTDLGESDLFNVVVYQCTDGVNDSPGSP